MLNASEKRFRLRVLFTSFFSISAVTLGGGLAMLPMMQRTFTEKHRWMTEEEMVDTVAVMQSSPGIIAVNMAVLIGYRVCGVSGAFAAAAGAVLPPFVSIVIVAALIRSLTLSPAVDQVFSGVRAAVCALILVSVIRLSRQILKGVFPAVIAGIGFLALTFFNVSAVLLIVLAALAGLVRNFRSLIRKSEENRP